jgi:DUF1680 family protein
MKLCFNLYRATGELKYADEIERTGYNALLAAQTPDGVTFAQYSPLEGYRYTGRIAMQYEYQLLHRQRAKGTAATA